MALEVQLKSWLIQRSGEMGFALAGVAPAGRAEHADAYLAWLAEGRHASMDFLARDVQARLDIRVQFPWARSVLCLAAGYNSCGTASPGCESEESARPVRAVAPDSSCGIPARRDPGCGSIARYARGRDYHRVLKARCHRLADELAARVEGVRTQCCVDTAPVLERSVAASAGLGWIGRNCCLINPRWGSWLVLAEIVLSIDLPADQPMPDQCGQCRLCIDACPNRALVAPRTLDARRCASWATVENRGGVDGDSLNLTGQLFGCDVCQSVCPFNRDVPEGMPELATPLGLSGVRAMDVLGWMKDDWDAATRSSAARRAKYEMWLCNACVQAGQQRLAEARDRLAALADHPDPSVSSAARWALGRLEGTGYFSA